MNNKKHHKKIPYPNHVQGKFGQGKSYALNKVTEDGNTSYEHIEIDSNIKTIKNILGFDFDVRSLKSGDTVICKSGAGGISLGKSYIVEAVFRLEFVGFVISVINDLGKKENYSHEYFNIYK